MKRVGMLIICFDVRHTWPLEHLFYPLRVLGATFMAMVPPKKRYKKKRNHSLITVLLPAKNENPFRPRVCGSLSFVCLSIDENSKRTFLEFNTCRHITQNQTEKDSLFLSRPLAPPPLPPPLFSLVSKFSLFKFFNVFTLLPTD